MAKRKKKATRKKATKKKVSRKKVSKKKATKKTKKKKRKRTAGTSNPAFMTPMKPSSDFAVVVGSKAMPRTKLVKKLWDYIKKKKLQDKKDKRYILADSNLQKVFGKKRVSMFEMNKLLKKHFKKA